MPRTVKLPLALAVLTAGAIARFAAGGPPPAAEPPAPAPAAVPALAQPALSPDGSTIAFAAGGDLWTVAASGGTAHLLISDPATESRPLYSPDGRSLAFVSTRTGNGDVYLFTFATGAVKRLTWDDDPEQLDGWSRDGRWLYFSSAAHDIASMNDVFRVHPEGGTPLEVTADRYVSEFFAAPAPDGKTLAFSARGTSAQLWWRHGHSHLEESEIWLLKDGAYRQLTGAGGAGGAGAKDLWPMWSPDGRRLYFASDRGGAENLWAQEVPAPGETPETSEPPEPRPLTHFTAGRVLWPAISADGRTLVFERDLGIWKLDLGSGTAAPVAITLEGAPAGPPVEHRRMTSDFTSLALSPDGKKVAFVAHGDVFAAAAQDGGAATRVTDTPGVESQVVWAPDSRRIAYVSDRDGVDHLFLYDFTTGEESRLTAGPDADDAPRFSPDGKTLAFERGRQELRALDLATRHEHRLAAALLDAPPLGSDRPFAWSPDSRWLAFLSYGERLFRNLQVVPAAGGEPRAVTYLANTNADQVSWSPDGRALFYATNQRTEDGRLARVDLEPRTPKFTEDQFRKLFEAEPKDAKGTGKPAEKEKKTPPVEIDFTGIRQRLTLLPVGLDVQAAVVSPDGKQVVLIASAGGQSNVYAFSIEEPAKERPVPRQLSATAGEKDALQVSPDSKEVYYLDGGAIEVAALDGSVKPHPLAVNAETDVDFARDKLVVFDQAWRWLRDNFVDPGMHGVDWDAARALYLPRAAAARTSDDLRRVLNLMIGELNASHSGVRLPAAGVPRTTGRLGLRFDREEYEAAGRLRVREVVPLGPAAVTGKVAAGDYLLAVDGRPVDGSTNLDQLLERKVNRRVTLTVAAAAEGAAARQVAVRPVDLRAEKPLVYRRWVEANREYVARASGGRLGYVHMFDMSSASLSQLVLDLDTENHARDGVLIDVRNNNGGFVNPYAIDILSRRGYMNMTVRGLPTAPARDLLGQRALERPTILLTNQHSLSDAEDFAEGYRSLGLGKVVGEPTAGWIIYTSDVDLLDGAQVRLPSVKITDRTGQDMEMHPRPVDLAVVRPIGEGLAGKDSQLDAAVRELLQEIKK